jgi:myo-inositol-1(or 4)-monophosphatase
MDEIERTALRAADRARRILLDYWRNAAVYEKGSSNNLVTEADLRSQEAIREEVLACFPGHVFYGEEGIEKGSLEAEHLWIVDPLDGTTNYAHGIPIFCVSIAYAYKGEVRYAVVDDPIHDERFTARRGKGAFINGCPTRVSGRGRMQESVIATGFYYDRGALMRRTLRSIEALFDGGVRCVRRMGSAAIDMCWVAAGRMEGFFEYILSPWDFAAAMLIVHEAGGICTDCDGKDLSIRSGNVIASNVLIHKELQRILFTTA